jgi:transcriptional regulator with XRE-family HTH domain
MQKSLELGAWLVQTFSFATEEEIRIALCNRLKENRLQQGLQQVEVALRAGVGRATVNRLEASAQTSLENFVRIAMALGLAEQLEPLFLLKPASIAAMEQAEGKKRMRAPRKRPAGPK